MEATAFAQLQTREDSDERDVASESFFVCSIDPFVFTYGVQNDDLKEPFERWLDTTLAVAMKEFSDKVTS